MLWIAYNFLSLQGSLQSNFLYICFKISCELLTIFYLYKVLCSFKRWIKRIKRVVNCLQFFIFTRFFAVSCKFLVAAFRLWIAYNFLSLQGSLQWPCFGYYFTISCELLTIFYLYKVLCSDGTIVDLTAFVVNCLQFFIFTRFFAVRHLLLP